MSVYRCGMCEEYKDTDDHGCYEHPDNEWLNICEECHMELEDENNT